MSLPATRVRVQPPAPTKPIGKDPIAVAKFRKDNRYIAHVFTRTKWSDRWRYRPHVNVLQMTRALHPTIGNATFAIEYGDAVRQGVTGYRQTPKESFVNMFVCVWVVPLDAVDPDEREPYTIWTGYVASEFTNVGGSQFQTPLVPRTTGTHTFRALELTWLLKTRELFDSTYATLSSGVPITFDRLPNFNTQTKRDRTIIGNRSTDRVVDGAVKPMWGFYGGVNDPVSTWTMYDVLEYLLWKSWNPKDNNTDEPQFVVGGDQTLETYLRSVVAVVRQVGSVHAIITKMFPRNRGISFFPRVEMSSTNGLPKPNAPVELVFVPLNDETLALSGLEYPTNPARVEVIVDDDDLSIDETIVSVDHTMQYDKLVVQGNPVVLCFTVVTDAGKGVWSDPGTWPMADNPKFDKEEPTASPATNWVWNYTSKLWTDDGAERNWEFVPYAPVPGLDVGRYLIMSPAWAAGIEAALNAEDITGRAAEMYGAVYREYEVSQGVYTQADEDSTKLVLSFNANATEIPGTGAVVWYGEARILNWTPLPELADTLAEQRAPGFMPPTAFVQDHGTNKQAWHRADAPIAGRPAKVTALERPRAFRIEFNPGITLGLHHTTHDGALFDFDRTAVTLAHETDVVPTVTIVKGTGSRTKVIRVPDAEYWKVAPGTWHGINPAGNPSLHPGGVVRDDTGRLRDIALRASAWFGQPRVSIKQRTHGLLRSHELGTVIHAKAAGQDLDANGGVVSLISYDVPGRTTTYQTSQIELDLLR